MKTISAMMVAWLVLTAGSGLARVADFSRYEVILARRPFGEPPPAEAVDPGQGPGPETAGPSFADSLRIVALTYSQGDVRVGFVDSAKTPPKTYFLFVGERQDGIEVVSASYEEERAVLRKEGDERTLSMAQGGRVVETVRPAAGGAAPVRPGAEALMQARRTGPAGGRTASPRVLSPGRQMRLEEEQRRLETLPDLHGQVLEKHLQEYNMEAIRSGAPPLPIPLTEEQDAQLVTEGLLPSVGPAE